MGSKPINAPIDSNVEFNGEIGDLYSDPRLRLVGKLIYLSVTQIEITFVLGVVSQFMHSPKSH